jgi:hypothetical protein
MTLSMRPETWLRFIRQEYLESFIRDGGAAIKFCVPLDDPPLRVISTELPAMAAGMGYLVAGVNASETRIHLLDHLFFRVAEQVPWEALSRRVLESACSALGYEIPEATGQPFCEALARKNRVEASLVLMELRRRLSDSVLKRSDLTRDFRLAMTQLCLADLTGGPEGAAAVQTLKDWLTGRNKAISALKPFQIFNRIARNNARHHFESMLRWVKSAGYVGTFVLIDMARLGVKRNPRDGQVYYTTAALLDAYEVMRQFIDSADRLANCLFVVVPGLFFLDEDITGRGMGRYEALKFRIYDEVKALTVVNPMASLVRVSSGAPEVSP